MERDDIDCDLQEQKTTSAQDEVVSENVMATRLINGVQMCRQPFHKTESNAQQVGERRDSEHCIRADRHVLISKAVGQCNTSKGRDCILRTRTGWGNHSSATLH
jgi:hypothetical protein